MKSFTINFEQEDTIIIKYKSKGFTKLECIGLINLAIDGLLHELKLKDKSSKIEHKNPYDLNEHEDLKKVNNENKKV